MRDPCDVNYVRLHYMCLLFVETVPERFGMRDPYVRDVPGFDSRVCVHRSLV